MTDERALLRSVASVVVREKRNRHRGEGKMKWRMKEGRTGEEEEEEERERERMMKKKRRKERVEETTQQQPSKWTSKGTSGEFFYPEMKAHLAEEKISEKARCTQWRCAMYYVLCTMCALGNKWQRKTRLRVQVTSYELPVTSSVRRGTNSV